MRPPPCLARSLNLIDRLVWQKWHLNRHWKRVWLLLLLLLLWSRYMLRVILPPDLPLLPPLHRLHRHSHHSSFSRPNSLLLGEMFLFLKARHFSSSIHALASIIFTYHLRDLTARRTSPSYATTSGKTAQYRSSSSVSFSLFALVLVIIILKVSS